MNASQYRRFRAVLCLVLVIWAVAAVGIIGFWADLPIVLKGIAVAIGVVLIPDITAFVQVFSSYERYSREGLE